MARSVSSRIALGSTLWTLGIIALAVALASGTMRHSGGQMVIVPLHFGAAGFAAAILLVGGLLQFRQSVSPFQELRQRLQAVKDGTAATIDGSYPDEVQPVVSDLNALLKQQANAVARAQTKAGDLAHGLKTPLAVLAQEAERVSADGRADVAESIRHQVALMQRHVTYHLAQARAAASGATLNARCKVSESAEGLARTLRRLYADRKLTIDVHVDTAHAVRVQREDLDEILGNVLDNACKWTRGRVQLSSISSGSPNGRIVIAIDDDGAGVAAELRDTVLKRGMRADEAAPGSGLGLAIVRDLAELYGGSVRLTDSALGGLRVEVDLPAA